MSGQEKDYPVCPGQVGCDFGYIRFLDWWASEHCDSCGQVRDYDHPFREGPSGKKIGEESDFHPRPKDGYPQLIHTGNCFQHRSEASVLSLYETACRFGGVQAELGWGDEVPP